MIQHKRLALQKLGSSWKLSFAACFGEHPFGEIEPLLELRDLRLGPVQPVFESVELIRVDGSGKLAAPEEQHFHPNPQEDEGETGCAQGDDPLHYGAEIEH